MADATLTTTEKSMHNSGTAERYWRSVQIYIFWPSPRRGLIMELQTVKYLSLDIRFSEAIDLTVKVVGLQCTSKNLSP